MRIVALLACAACGIGAGDGQTDLSNPTGTADSGTNLVPPTGDTAPYRPGPPNVATTGSAETCLLLFGGNDRVLGPDDGFGITDMPVGTAPRTVQVWVRTNKLQAQTAFSYGRPSYGQGVQIGTDDGFPFFRTGWSSTQVVTGDQYIADDEWHHLVGSWDGTLAFVMVDGEVVGSGPLPGNTLEGDIVAGNTPTGDLSKSWIGWVDDAKVFRRARLPEEIAADWDGENVAPSDLSFWWDFEVPENSAGPGIEVPDLSGNGHDGLSAGIETPQFPRCR